MENHRPVVPPGYRFDPTDQELIRKFLHSRVVEQLPLPYPHNQAINECNMFGTPSVPSQIWAAYGGADQVGDSQGLYFFSEIKRVTPKGSHFVRKMGPGKGTWNGKSISVMVYGDDSNPIGQKRTFRYDNKGHPDDGGWLLNEYSLFSSPRNNEQRNNKTVYDFDVVLCRLRKKDSLVIESDNNNNKRKSPCPASSSSCSQDVQINPIQKMRPPKKVTSFQDLMKSDEEEEEVVAMKEEDTDWSLSLIEDLMCVETQKEEEEKEANMSEQALQVLVSLPTASVDAKEASMSEQPPEVVPVPWSNTAADGAEDEEETCIPNFVEHVGTETVDEPLPAEPWDGFNDFIAEVQQDQFLPTTYGTSGHENEVWPDEFWDDLFCV